MTACHIDAESVLSGPQMLSSSPAVFARSMAHTSDLWKSFSYGQCCDENAAGPSSWQNMHGAPDQNTALAQVRCRSEAQGDGGSRCRKVCGGSRIGNKKRHAESQEGNIRRTHRSTRPPCSQNISLVRMQRTLYSFQEQGELLPYISRSLSEDIFREVRRDVLPHTRHTSCWSCKRRRTRAFHVPFRIRKPTTPPPKTVSPQAPPHTGYDKFFQASLVVLLSTDSFSSAREGRLNTLATSPPYCTTYSLYPPTSPGPFRMPPPGPLQDS